MDGAAGIVESTEVDTAFVERFLAARVTEEASRRSAPQPAEVIAFTLLMIQARPTAPTERGPPLSDGGTGSVPSDVTLRASQPALSAMSEH